VALPRARQRDTPAYEWTMIQRETARGEIMQIKTGSDHVDPQALADARADDQTDTFAFATCDAYDGDRQVVNETIEQGDLLAFAAERPGLLPTRVRTWFELAGY
jgi:hypothetical protein